jgi:ATP-dependent phosphofructokinase / diphosphate-dependent phosphofructokinase
VAQGRTALCPAPGGGHDRHVRIGVLTGGGDCPGLNAVLRAIVIRAEGQHGHAVIGFRHGWRGVVESDEVDLTMDSTHGILQLGGTILGTSRYHPHEVPGALEAIVETVARDRIDCLVVVGGDGTLGAALRVHEAGVPVIGVPKTIDNDVRGTDVSIGFDTAVAIATEAIDRVHTTAESHDRVMVVEVMGHRAGWIAACAGIAGGAHLILLPEEPFGIDDVCARLTHRHRRGATASVVVVAEGATPIAGTLEPIPAGGPDEPVVAGAVGELVRREIEHRTGFEARVVVLGHTQRGGPPTATDRMLGSRLGIAAADAAHDGAFGTLVAIRNGALVRIPLADAVDGSRPLDPSIQEAVHVLTA